MMKKLKFSLYGKAAILLLTVGIAVSGCKKKDDDPEPAPKKSYNLKAKDVLGVSGTVTFTKKSATSVQVDIVLTGAAATVHPAHMHQNSAVETGGIMVPLNDVDATGKSTTLVTTLTYEQMLAVDAYINVHESAANLTTIIAQGDVGGNELTGTKKQYVLAQVGTSGVSGTATLEQRKNLNSLLTIVLTGTIAGGSHPSHIHLGSVATVGGGPVVISLNNIDGATGKSYTNIRKLDAGTPITYSDLLVYDGYLNVHESDVNLTNILCQGDIGSNAN